MILQRISNSDFVDMLNLQTKLKSTYLRPEFVAQLQAEARKLRLIERAKSRKQFHFARLTLSEWESLSRDIKDEITKYGHYIECSYWINAAHEYPLISASGQTLRRWCEVYETFRDIPSFEEFEKVLSFDHFQKARWLANIEKVSVPIYAIAIAIEHKYTADEMVNHFCPEKQDGAHPYDKAIGWMDSLQAIKYEWIKSPEVRQQVAYHLSEARRLLEAER